MPEENKSTAAAEIDAMRDELVALGKELWEELGNVHTQLTKVNGVADEDIHEMSMKVVALREKIRTKLVGTPANYPLAPEEKKD